MYFGWQLDEPYDFPGDPSRMQQCFNVLDIYIYHEFLLLFYCCIVLEIKRTTTAASATASATATATATATDTATATKTTTTTTTTTTINNNNNTNTWANTNTRLLGWRIW